MSETLERLARASCRANIIAASEEAGRSERAAADTDALVERLWRNHVPRVRALLQELREPDEAMLTAGIDASPMWLVDRGPKGAKMPVLGRERNSLSTGEVKTILQAMIDHLLGDPQP